MLRSVATAIILLQLGAPSWAQAPITVGDVIIDPPTIATLGFSVPIDAGDDNYNAIANVQYRESGSSTWKQALPLLRVRPETISAETPPEDFGFSRPGEQFAGSVFHLEADTTYDVQIEVIDPDGGNRTQLVQVTTRKVPRPQPVTPNTVTVTNAAELDDALLNAAAGDVIELAAGTYTGRFDLVGGAGTEENPIVIRGPLTGAAAVIDGAGQSIALNIGNSNHVHVEHLTIVGVTGTSRYGLRLSGNDLVARNLVIDTDNGIDAQNHLNRGFYICDNTLSGPTVWPTVAVGANAGEKRWVGIGIRGRGHTVCHNSLSAFGSTMLVGYSGQAGPTHSLAIDFHNNDIAWSADDGFEFDGSLRNVRAWQNRVRNTLMSLSFQPVWGGPIYAFRNVIYNPAAAPFKLNNDPSGVILYHNTTVRYGENDITGPYDSNAWPQLGLITSYAANCVIANNIMVGNDDALFLRQEMPLMQLDYNGYSPDGSFSLQSGGVLNAYADLAAFQAASGFESNGTALGADIFETAPPASPDYKIFAPALEFLLHSQSGAVDRAVDLPNINDLRQGAAADLGAHELGDAAPVYGVRTIDTMPPAAPEGLAVVIE